MALEFGTTLPCQGPLAHPESLAQLALRAQELGFESVWAPDHVVLPIAVEGGTYPYTADGSPPWAEHEELLAPLITLAWVASIAKDVRLGVSILVLPLRNALIAAKDIGTLDFLSGGRLVLGVGSGWLREEFDILGLRFDERFERTEEGIRLLRACWTTEPVEHHGTFYDLDPFSMMPKPGPVPVWGGGTSERWLRIVVGVCDGWHPANLLPDEWALGATRVRELLAESGRDQETLTLTARPARDVVVDRELADAYARAGAVHILAPVEYRAIDSVAEAITTMEQLAQRLHL